ncbi:MULTISPECIES: hypothetical protein [Streptomyces]|uniref:Secreted protein n=1 Tax=Streptomyces avermitilis TaxID=33903 RepID=A0A4D4MRL5_STRAX|nr:MULTISPECIES: hypothetical protein [Streptomyces]MYT00481.1 hypothetical protein [Streptomyces sp. SID5469]BBJ52978.1 hypothetical protein SAVMC3_56070 [Streptomyces avermitilis]GDY64998.1 hypothetical protein SAV14893_043910 [Streptomyces avermitilis]GDY74800.1 hypothetical protein SAV31267_042850 [Streptomyces avermitilis]GDY83838.1 hypothetical protein SAVCW2_30370 [Streptomyces avermitilis]
MSVVIVLEGAVAAGPRDGRGTTPRRAGRAESRGRLPSRPAGVVVRRRPRPARRIRGRRPQQGGPGPLRRQPPAQGYRCRYATDWVADKTKWGLSVDPTQEAALAEALSRCRDVPV